MFREVGERRASATITGLAGPGAAAAAANGRWRWLRLFFSVIWLVYLAQPLSNLPHLHHGALWMAAAASVTAAFCVVFVAVVVSWDHRPVLARRALIVLVALAAVVSLLFLPGSNGQNVVWIYVSSAAGWVVPDRRAAIRTVFGIAACFLLFSWLAHDGVSDMLITLIPVVFVGITMAGIRVQIKLMRELAEARETVAMMAASDERLRLARDMHDLTGQSLSMITLKSELAARLLRRLPEGTDRDRVADEIQQVAAVSRQTLHDIREAISGYRRPTLAVEIITARSALESAGIGVRDDPGLTLVSGTIDTDAEAALAWCLREAVTNVIRHSGAENCSIGLTRRDGELSLEVRDDGRGCPPGGPASASGTGLHGMAERLSAVGGHLELHPDTPGFRLIATVPAREYPARHAAWHPSGHAAGHAPGDASQDAAAGITVTT